MVGCAGGDGRGGGPSSSGISGSKLLNTLTSSEVAQMCEFQEASYKAGLTSEQVYCLHLTDPEYCEQDLEYCIGSGDYQAELNDNWSCDSDAEAYATCDATVTELEACVADYNRDWSMRLADKTCATLEESDVAEVVPPSCAVLFGKCPEVSL